MLSEFELKKVEKAVAPLLLPRGTPHVMSGGEAGYRVKGHEVLLFTRRKRWNNQNEEIELDLAKFKYVRASNLWHLYWQRASGKWQGYEPLAVARDIEVLAQEVLRDPHGCFWG